MKFLKKLVVFSSFLTYGSLCLAHTARPIVIIGSTGSQIETIEKSLVQAQKNSEAESQKIDENISAVMNIIENESFVMKKVYHDGFQGNIRNCVFESPSAVWTIKYCEDIGNKLLEGVWYSLAAGVFDIKNAEMKVDYYLELPGRKHIYEEFDRFTGQYVMESLALRRVSFKEGDSNDMSIKNWSEKRFSFLQALARTQEQYIEQSLTAPASSAD